MALRLDLRAVTVQLRHTINVPGQACAQERARVHPVTRIRATRYLHSQTVRPALLLAVGTCNLLSFEAMPGLCCFSV